MFPKEFSNKIISVGNSSLNGCVKYATDEKLKHRADAIRNTANEINLSNDNDFNDLYTEHMYFE